VKLKQSYSAREVAALSGLTARQLQWWDQRRLFEASVAARPTAAGGFTERRYSPVDLYELLALANLRRKGFTAQNIRSLLEALRAQFGVRLFDALGEDGAVTLLTDGREIYARTTRGEFFNLLRAPGQPLLVIGGEAELKGLSARVRAKRTRKTAKKSKASKAATRRPKS
jgi:DNA-binding transcriptional MerR regulator